MIIPHFAGGQAYAQRYKSRVALGRWFSHNELRKYSRDTVASVLAAADIVEVVGTRVELKPAGAGRWVGRCPFHQEKTPSFSVNRERQFYYCFGCGQHGDALKFLREYEGLSFLDALRVLAERSGIRLPAEMETEDREDGLRSRLLELNQHAASFFQKTLADSHQGEVARRYLETRGLKPETIRRFGLGYAPDDWDALPEAIRAKGFTDEQAEASGLVRRNDRGTRYPFFRNRLMAPIQDAMGNYVAFGGRELAGDPKAPKYINTPENMLYKKGQVLYGLNHAREAIRRENRVVLVEGYFDLMRCFDSGIENVAAPCGTALTPMHARLLKRYADEVVEVFDGDTAGIRAALRGVGILVAAGLSVKAALLPDGHDPDDYIAHNGADAFAAMLTGAQDFVSFYVQVSEPRLGTIEGRTQVARELFVIIADLEDELRKEEYLKAMARSLKLDEWAAKREYERMAQESSRQKTMSARESATVVAPSRPVARDDLSCVAAILQHPELRHQARQQLEGMPLPATPLAETLRYVCLGENRQADDDTQASEGGFSTEQAEALYAAASNIDGIEPERAAELVTMRIRALRIDALTEELRGQREALRNAERQHDSAAISHLMARCIHLKREIEKLGAA